MQARPAHELRSNVKRTRKARAEIMALINELTQEVRFIEDDVAKANPLKRHHLSDAMAPYYLPMVDNIVQNMRNVSAALFAKVSVRHIHVYDQAKDVPSDVSAILYAAQNLTNMIVEEILSGATVTHARLAFERWIAVMKRAHETHDYFTANVICLALSSEPMLLSGLSQTVTITARAVLEYLERQYLHPSFIYNLQVYHTANGRDVIPMITTLSYMMARSEKLPEAVSEAQAQFREMRHRVRATRQRPSHALMRHIKKEPATSHEKRFMFYAEAIKGTKIWRMRELNLTLHSLKLFDASDRFYIAKHTIEMSLNKLARLEEPNRGLNEVIWNVIRDEHLSDAEKSKSLKGCYRKYHERMGVGLKHIVICVRDAYKVIAHYKEKADCVEPCVMPYEDSEGSLSSSEESEIIKVPKKKFSWIHSEERALKRAVVAQSIPSNTLTPRKSFGLFRSASQLPLRRQEDVASSRFSRRSGSLDV